MYIYNIYIYIYICNHKKIFIKMKTRQKGNILGILIGNVVTFIIIYKRNPLSYLVISLSHARHHVWLVLNSYVPLIRPINALIWNPRAAGHDVSVCNAAEVPHSAGNTFMWSWLNLCSSLPSTGLEYDLGSEIHLDPHTHTCSAPAPGQCDWQLGVVWWD